MNTKQNTIKNILCGLIGIILIVLAHFGVVILKQPNFTVHADNNIEEGVLPISITNSSFTSSSTKATSFKSYGYISNTDSNILDLSKDKYPEAKRGSKFDNYVLCLSSSTYADYGYRNESNNLIEIKPNSFYSISVDVYTNANDSIADLYLYEGTSNVVFDSMLNINTTYSWVTCTFYLSTNSMQDLDLALGMNLQGTGTVLFDNISVKKLSEQKFITRSTATTSEPTSVKTCDSNLVVRYETKDDTFVKTSTETDLVLTSSELATIKDKTKLTKYSGKDSSIAIEYNKENSDGINNSAIYVENKEKTYIEYHTENDFITFKQNNLYKVSLNVKAENLDGEAYFKLVRTNAEDDDESKKDSDVVKITKSNADNDSNYYEEISFYVYSDPTKDTTYKLVFGLGNEENGASGKIYFNTLSISKVDYETYKNGKNKLDLTSYYAYSNTESSSTPMLNNGDFDASEITDVFSATPAQPTNWTVSTGKNTQYYGVVNTSKDSFDALKSLNTSLLSNPYGEDGENNNVLMMYNESEDILSYTSSTRTLKANTYHRYSVDLNTQFPNYGKESGNKVTVALVTTLNDKEVVLSSKDIYNTTSLTPIEMYIHTANQELKVAVKITLITKGYGYAYVDNAQFDLPLAPSENKFNSIDGTSEYISKVDLTQSNSNLDFFTISDTSIATKIINTKNSEELPKFLAEENLDSFSAIGDVDVIAVKADSYVNYTLTSNLGYDLAYSASNKSYYKVTVYAFTRALETKDSETEDFGASIKINGYDSSFTNIKSDNVWTAYTFFIAPTSAKTIYLEFGLGNETNLTKGGLFIANISVEDVTENYTEEEFNEIVEENTIKVIKTDATTDEEEKEDTTEDTEKEPMDLATILYWAAGSITSIALIIAIVGIAVRKIKFKKPVKKSKNEYDRNKTVSKQLYMRKATTERENKLRELNNDLEKLVAERTKFEEEYKKDLYKLRELKIKRASASEIAMFEKEMKKNQRASASLGVTINRVQTEIEYTKTDAYLNSLMRKLARENQTNITSTENKDNAQK